MAGPLGAAAIQAGASIIGGLLGRQKQIKPGDVVRQTVAGIQGQARGAREMGEKYGFNPLTLLGVSAPLVPQVVDNSMMGQAVANAGLAIAEGINEKTQQEAYAGALEEQNAELRKALDTATLRPKVAGIYGPQVGVAESATVPEVGPFGLPTVVRGPLDDRPEKINPLQNEPWFKKVNMFGKDLIGWNDEAAESEVMSTAVSFSFPFQLGFRYMMDPAFEPGKGYLRDRPGGNDLFTQMRMDWEEFHPKPVPAPQSKAGYLLARP